jgi:hypothetical protein
MQILTHARDLIPADRRNAESFLDLALGAAAVDVTRLVANLLA